MGCQGTHIRNRSRPGPTSALHQQSKRGWEWQRLRCQMTFAMATELTGWGSKQGQHRRTQWAPYRALQMYCVEEKRSGTERSAWTQLHSPRTHAYLDNSLLWIHLLQQVNVKVYTGKKKTVSDNPKWPLGLKSLFRSRTCVASFPGATQGEHFQRTWNTVGESRGVLIPTEGSGCAPPQAERRQGQHQGHTLGPFAPDIT